MIVEIPAEEIEEIRELLYVLLKSYPSGITSTHLEEQFEEKFVSCGLSRSLPKNWVDYLSVADEFEVKRHSDVTIVYLVHANGTSEKCEALEVNEMLPEIDLKDASLESDDAGLVVVEPMALSALPSGDNIAIRVVSAMDPDNIYAQLCSWVS